MKTTTNLFVLTFLIFLPVTSLADDEVAKQRLRLLEDVYAKLKSGDSFEMVAQIESEGTPREIANKYLVLISGLYRNKFDVRKMLVIGRAGVRFCLRESTRLAKENPELSTQLKGLAKAMAYNLSANVWPGWEEPKQTITESEVIVGLDLARLNYRLAGELERDAKVVGNAHWLVGAQHLALKQTKQAIEHFEKSASQFHDAQQPEYEHMALGYLSIAKLTADSSNAAESDKLATSLSKLKELGTGDAKFFAGQLQRVSKFFVK